LNFQRALPKSCIWNLVSLIFSVILSLLLGNLIMLQCVAGFLSLAVSFLGNRLMHKLTNIWRCGGEYSGKYEWFYVLSHFRFSFCCCSAGTGLYVHKMDLLNKRKPFRYFGTVKKNPNEDQRLILYGSSSRHRSGRAGYYSGALYASIRVLIGSKLAGTSTVLKCVFLSPSRKIRGIAWNMSSLRPSKSLPFHDSPVIILLDAI
jgi:hypothetical protein